MRALRSSNSTTSGQRRLQPLMDQKMFGLLSDTSGKRKVQERRRRRWMWMWTQIGSAGLILVSLVRTSSELQ